MALWKIAGNDRVKERLTESVRKGTVSHAYLLEGDFQTDKRGVAKEFAKGILCLDPQMGDACDQCASCRKMDHENYEDFIWVAAEGSSIKDEAILALQGQLTKKPCGGDRHVVIIENADTMTLRAQNRLLKTLEEPSAGTVIILLSENIENLVSTILSRCIVFRLHGADAEETDALKEQAWSFAELAVGRAPFYRMVEAVAEAAKGREAAGAFLDCLERRYRDLALCSFDKEEKLLFEPEQRGVLRTQSRLLRADQLAAAVAAVEEARRDLNRGVNPGYALKGMILKLY